MVHGVCASTCALPNSPRLSLNSPSPTAPLEVPEEHRWTLYQQAHTLPPLSAILSSVPPFPSCVSSLYIFIHSGASTISLMWMVPSLCLANLKSFKDALLIDYKLGQSPTHTHRQLRLTLGPAESSTLCLDCTAHLLLPVTSTVITSLVPS